MYDGGSDVSGYVVEILEEGSEQWYRATTKALKTNEYVAAGLAANKKYRFRVAAVNSNGTGEFSEPSAEIEPLERIGESVKNNAAVSIHQRFSLHYDGNKMGQTAKDEEFGSVNSDKICESAEELYRSQ